MLVSDSGTPFIIYLNNFTSPYPPSQLCQYLPPFYETSSFDCCIQRLAPKLSAASPRGGKLRYPGPPTLPAASSQSHFHWIKRTESWRPSTYYTGVTTSSWPHTGLLVHCKHVPSSNPTMHIGHRSLPTLLSSPSSHFPSALFFCKQPYRGASSASQLPWSADAYSKCWATSAE